MAACDFCGWKGDASELTPGPSGDPTCGDCHLDHADTRAAYAH
jgi:hypothetical protein